MYIKMSLKKTLKKLQKKNIYIHPLKCVNQNKIKTRFPFCIKLIFIKKRKINTSHSVL